MNVAGADVRGVSMIYATTVGKADATASVIIAPDADQVNISICPGVSSMMFLRPSVSFTQIRKKRNLLEGWCSFLQQSENLLKFGGKEI